MKHNLIVESWKKYLNEEEIGQLAPTASLTGSSVDELKPTEQEEKQKALSTIEASVENSFHDAIAVANKLQADKSALKTSIIKMVNDIIKEELAEAKKKSGDRCTRIAKRKYDVWPSAYASGAVVKCRQGKIWKGISESATDEEIDLALLTEEVEVIEEKWSDKYKRSINCKNPKGFSQKAHCQGKKKK
jgi:hypothetical protein